MKEIETGTGAGARGEDFSARVPRWDIGGLWFLLLAFIAALL